MRFGEIVIYIFGMDWLGNWIKMIGADYNV